MENKYNITEIMSSEYVDGIFRLSSLSKCLNNSINFFLYFNDGIGEYIDEENFFIKVYMD